MTKTKFRLLLVVSLLLSIVGVLYDFIWPDETFEKVMEYVYEVEPETEDAKLVVVAILGGLIFCIGIISFIGLLLFKNWARTIYVACFILSILLYPFMGLSVYSGAGQMFYDLSMIISGIILSMLYYSPVSIFYEKNNPT